MRLRSRPCERNWDDIGSMESSAVARRRSFIAPSIRNFSAVALKVMRWCGAGESNLVSRFWRDARIAARLRHPNIVPVHDAGELEGVRYIDMELIRGETLQEQLQRSDDRPMPFRTSTELILKLASALQYAHDAGIIHRDIKPSNILIDERGEPQLTDFGLARSGTDDESLTALGQIIGTPAYMSPEQAEGHGNSADHRTDTYSLGVVLYRLLAGKLPFAPNDSLIQLLAKISNEEPPRPRTVNPAIPHDLETICLKAMAKAPGDRFATARAFADELWRWLSDEPLTIRPLSPFDKVRRWARRHRALTRMLMVAGMLLVVVCAGLGWVIWDQREQRYQAELKSLDEQQKAESARQLREVEADKRAELEAWALLRRARVRLRIPTFGRRSETHEMLAQAAAIKNSLAASDARDHLGLEIRSIFAASMRDVDVRIDPIPVELPVVYYQAWQAALHPNREEIVIGTHLGPIRWQRGQAVKLPAGLDAIKPRPQPVFSPDGKYLAIYQHDGGLTLWDDRASRRIATYSATENGAILDIAFADGALRICHEDGMTRTVSVPGLNPISEWRLETESLAAARFSADGKAIAAGSNDGRVTLWSIAERKRHREFQAGRFAVTALAWSADSRLVAAGIEDGAVQVWNALDGTRSLQLATPWPSVGKLEFAMDGRWLMGGGREGEMTAWEIETGRPIISAPYIPSSFSRSGQRFAGSSNRRVAFCDLILPKSVREFTGHRTTIDRIVWSRDCRRLATLDHSFELRVWDVETGRPVCRAPLPRGSYSSANSGIALSDSGSTVAFCNGGEWSKLELHDANTGQLLSPARRLPTGVDRLACAGGERFVLVREERSQSGWQSVVYEFDRNLVLGQPRLLRPPQSGESGFHASNLTDDGRYYCWIGPRKPASHMRLELYDVATGTLARTFPCPQLKEVQSWGGGISGDGRFLWIRDEPLGSGMMYDLTTDGPPTRGEALLNFSRDRHWQAIVKGTDGFQERLPSILLKRSSDPEPWLQLSCSDLVGTGPGVFSPDGRYLAWISQNGAFTITDLPLLEREVEAFERSLDR